MTYIFEEYIRDPNMSRISRQFNERGIPSRCSRLLINELYQNGTTSTKWDRSAFFEILQNATYMGALALAKTRKVSPYSNKRVDIPLTEQTIIYDCHEGMVSRELWEKANEIHLQQTHARINRIRKTILHGFLYCAHCEKALRVNSGAITTCFCNYWPITGKVSSRCLNIKVIIRRLVSDIHNIAIECEEDENHAFSLISSCLSRVNNTQEADYNVQLFQIRKRIDILNDKIENLYKYCKDQELSSIQSNTVLTAMKASLRTEMAELEKCEAAHTTIASADDIREFICTARRFGYITEIDREVLENLIDKIYVSKKETSSWFQQECITIKFKYIGVLTTAPFALNLVSG